MRHGLRNSGRKKIIGGEPRRRFDRAAHRCRQQLLDLVDGATSWCDEVDIPIHHTILADQLLHDERGHVFSTHIADVARLVDRQQEPALVEQIQSRVENISASTIVASGQRRASVSASRARRRTETPWAGRPRTKTSATWPEHPIAATVWLGSFNRTTFPVSPNLARTAGHKRRAVRLTDIRRRAPEPFSVICPGRRRASS